MSTPFNLEGMECHPSFNDLLGECDGCTTDGIFTACEDCSLTGKCPMHGHEEEDE